MSVKSVSGNDDRLRLLGFGGPSQSSQDAPLGPQDEPLLRKLGKENASFEEKARVIAERFVDNLTEEDLKTLGSQGIERIAKLGGLGGVKKVAPADNPIIAAIILALGNLGVRPPEIQVIEQETLPGGPE